MTQELTQDMLKQWLHYEPETGVFTWIGKADPKAPNSFIGKRAGKADDGRGYRAIKILGKLWLEHRLAFLYMTGMWPKQGVDHIDGSRSNNAWKNLRAADGYVNAQNQRKPQKGNKSGFLGVSAHRSKFRAFIRVNGGAPMRIGTFDTPEEAHQAYVEAKRRLHPGCTL